MQPTRKESARDGRKDGARQLPAAATQPKGVADRRVIVSASAARTWFEAVEGERIAVRLASKQVGGAYAVVESCAAPGAATPLHYHRDCDEVFYIVSGALRFFCDSEQIDADSGTCIAIPRGAEHAWTNMGDTPATALVFFSPGGTEEIFQRMSLIPREELGEFTAKYGTFVVGPPPEVK